MDRCMDNKRGQITLFVIVGIVLLSLSAIVFYIMDAPQDVGKEAMEMQEFEESVQSAYNYIELCIKQEADTAVWLFGAHGGSVFEPNELLFLVWNESMPRPIMLAGEYIDVLQYATYNMMPIDDFLKLDIEDYVEFKAEDCAKKVPALLGLNISVGKPNAAAKISEESVEVEVESEVTLTRGEQNKKLEIFYAKIDVPLGKILREVRNIIYAATKIPGNIPLQAIADSGFNVSVSEYDDKTYLYLLTDEDNTLFGRPYNFLWAARYEI